jgi:hypothetical protein
LFQGRAGGGLVDRISRLDGDAARNQGDAQNYKSNCFHELTGLIQLRSHI